MSNDKQLFCLKALNQRVISLGSVDDLSIVIDAALGFDAVACIRSIGFVTGRPRINGGLWNSSPFRTQPVVESASADFPPLARHLFAGGSSDQQTHPAPSTRSDIDHRSIAQFQSSGNADKTLRLNRYRLGFNGQGLTFGVTRSIVHPLPLGAQFFSYPQSFTSISASFVSQSRRSTWAK